jgi:hypothetical protein
VAAGLDDSTPSWTKYPKDMLVNRAMTRAVKFAFPQAVVGGFGPVGIEEDDLVAPEDTNPEVDPETGEVLDD